MALINCPECGKEISDKAISCPNCGVPPSKEISQLEKKNEEQMEILPFPNLPENLDIGRQITNWAFDAAFEGFVEAEHGYTGIKDLDGKESEVIVLEKV